MNWLNEMTYENDILIVKSYYINTLYQENLQQLNALIESENRQNFFRRYHGDAEVNVTLI